jgi:CBS domain-containing protein
MKTLGELVKNKPVYVVRKDQTVLEAVKDMVRYHVGAVPVVDGDRLVGIFSERDLMVRCVAGGMDLGKTNVEDVMTKELIATNINDSWEECLVIMKKKGIRHLPVIEDDRLAGVVSLRDLMQIDVEEKEQKIDVLHSYIHYNPKGNK